ncbi:unnamed protein product [Nyctereutes procyonoides]|uniref:(raccoon dog) hypothetical protein n=1 Tax=Nyctereutes procyonoides TaxID=34880 RepID=A0A811ZEF7_NYCPR|nr:unnamed protein product [Nyctereutes procyonoides]
MYFAWPTANISLNGETLRAFPLRSGTCQDARSHHCCSSYFRSSHCRGRAFPCYLPHGQTELRCIWRITKSMAYSLVSCSWSMDICAMRKQYTKVMASKLLSLTSVIIYLLIQQTPPEGLLSSRKCLAAGAYKRGQMGSALQQYIPVQQSTTGAPIKFDQSTLVISARHFLW